MSTRGGSTCWLWNTKPWGILKRDPVALPVLSLGLVPRFSSTLLSCPILSTALVFFFPAFYLWPSHQNLRTCFTVVIVITNTGNHELFYGGLYKRVNSLDIRNGECEVKNIFSASLRLTFLWLTALSKFWCFYLKYFTPVIGVVMRNTTCVQWPGEGG